MMRQTPASHRISGADEELSIVQGGNESAGDTWPDPYRESTAASRLSERVVPGDAVCVTMLDIDSTLTGDRESAQRVRALLDRRGAVTVFNTSRTEEMVMTRASFDASRARGWFHRPPPHLGMDGSRHVDVPQERVEPVALLDPDVIAGSTGTRILLRQPDGGYLPDSTYGELEETPPGVWRREVVDLLAAMNAQGQVVTLAPIEERDHYDAGLSDVYPPDYRIQVNFAGPEDRREVLRRLAGIRRNAPEENSLSRRARRIRVLDDSEPRHGRYKAFVMPRWASKARAARHIVRELRGHVPDLVVDLLFVGDSYPDLHMALFGGGRTRSTLLLVGGSRLTDVLVKPDISRFAGMDFRAVKRRLKFTGQPGFYRYRAPCAQNSDVLIVIGDMAFPGSTAVETVERYLAPV